MQKYLDFKKGSYYCKQIMKQIAKGEVERKEGEKMMRRYYDRQHSCVHTGHVSSELKLKF